MEELQWWLSERYRLAREIDRLEKTLALCSESGRLPLHMELVNLLDELIRVQRLIIAERLSKIDDPAIKSRVKKLISSTKSYQLLPGTQKELCTPIGKLIEEHES